MKTSRYFAPLMTSFGLLLALSAASPDCSAQAIPENSDVYFISNGDFNTAATWGNGLAPSLEPTPPLARGNVYGIDDGLSATFSGGTTTVLGLRVGSVHKDHNVGETHFGRLTMTGGTLEVIGDAGTGAFSIGRERAASSQFPKPMGADYNQNTVVDAADYVIWRKIFGSTYDLRADGDGPMTPGVPDGVVDSLDYDYWRASYGNVVHGGEIIMINDSIVRANGVIIGERTHGLLSVGPGAVVDLRDWVPATVEPPVSAHFGGSQDVRIGNYGPAFQTFTEFGMDGNGLVDLQGTLNANVMRFSENGGKGELRLSGGGTVNLNGDLNMTACLGCVFPTTDARKALLALQSAKVSIIGSSGSFKVGLDPDTLVVDPMPGSRDIMANNLAFHSPAIFSFTADLGGVTPITVVDNTVSGEISGTAFIAGAKLELNLDAYTGAGPLILIDAKPGNVSGQFLTPTFLGSRTAIVNYDEVATTGNVRLINFSQIGAGAGTGSLAGGEVPEPSGLAMITLALGLLLCPFSAGARRPTFSRWGCRCLKVRA